MQRYRGYYTPETASDIQRQLAQTRVLYATAPKPKMTREERERKALERIEKKVQANRLRQAPASDYVPASRLPQKFQEKLEQPKRAVDYAKAKEDKRRKQAALAAYDAKYGTKLARPKPATLKRGSVTIYRKVDGRNVSEEIGPLVSWNQVVASVMSNPENEKLTMKEKIQMASRTWRGMGEKLVRPDIAEKASASPKRTISRGAVEAIEASRARAAAKREALRSNPEEYAQMVFQEKVGQKVREEQKLARKFGGPVEGGAGPLLRYVNVRGQEYLMSRAQMARIFKNPDSRGGRTLDQIWGAGRPYAEAVPRVARKIRAEPLASYTGYTVEPEYRKAVPVRGTGVYSRGATAEEIEAALAAYREAKQEIEEMPEARTR